MAETAELLVKVLRVFRREGYLSPEVLESLPIQPAAFSEDSMFRPVFERVRRAFAEEPLLPDDTGDAVCAGNAVLSRGSGLRELLSSSQLAQLLNKNVPLKWLSREITQDRTPVLRSYLRTELGISELEPERFARLISEPFLVRQPDDWMARFYTYLLRQEALWGTKALGRSEGLLRKQPILRLSDGRHVVPFKADGTPAAYLPGGCDLRVPVVKENIAADEQASEFLRRLGLREPDPVDEVCASLLPKYRRVPQPCPSDDEYASDIRAILAAIRTDSSINRLRVITDAKKTPFLLATNAKTGQAELKTPLDVYMRSDHLALYFSENPNAWFLAEGGAMDLLGAEARQLLGIADTPRLKAFSRTLTAKQKEKLRGGMKVTRPREEKVQDYDIDGLAEALALAEQTAGGPDSARIGQIVWNVMLKLQAQHTHDDFWQGRYDWFNYEPRKSLFDATFLGRLKKAAWIPDRQGTLRRSADIDVSELPDSLEVNDEVIEKLGLKNAHDERQQELAEKQKHAACLGVELDIIDFIRQHAEAFARFRKDVVAAQSVAPAFPESTSANPVRREARIQESRKEAASKTYEKRERSIRTSAPVLDPKMSLRDNYTNDNDQMVCQMCEQEMPFRIPPSGDYYFEAVELTRRTEFEHHAMRLALCPVCAARYRVFIHQNPEAQAAVEAALLTTETTEAQSPRISLKLGYEKGTLRFVHKHLVDVKGLLKQ